MALPLSSQREMYSTMLFLFIITLLNVVWSYETIPDKYLNTIDNDLNPFYHTIVIKDVAEVMNEIDNNLVPTVEDIFLSNSGSNENIEDLLSEYQHYLDKAKMNRKKYTEKTKSKNKIPLVRHDPYKKQNTGHNKYNNYVLPPNDMYNVKPLQYSYSMPNVVDLFIPSTYISKGDTSTTEPKGQQKIVDEEALQENMLSTPDQKNSGNGQLGKEANIACICQSNQTPCDCNCAECQVPNYNQKSVQNNDIMNFPLSQETLFGVSSPKNYKYGKGMLNDIFNNFMNIQMKLNIQIPKYPEYISDTCPNCGIQKTPDMMDLVPLPFYTFPAIEPMAQSNYLKIKSDNYNPMHKITIHKKKKSRMSTANKKHRKKGAILIQNFNNAPDTHPITVNKWHTEETTKTNENIMNNPFSNSSKDSEHLHSATDNNTNSTVPQEKFTVTVNVTFNSDNQTSDYTKTDEPIENEIKTTTNDTSMQAVKSRKKRETSTADVTNIQNVTKVNSTLVFNQKPKKTEDVLEIDKNTISDKELLYWPTITINDTTISKLNNTTTFAIQLNKTSLNITENLKDKNDTKSLLDVIFHNIDWNNEDTIAPVFISYFGKYFNGMLTFCSEKICHSIKCSDKLCVHRTCSQENRQNQRGHCNKSNTTDSVASMEFSMDLTPKVALDVVNKLEEKLLGNLFGKGTFCMSSKCITFVASKKIFLKTKCASKVLNEAGHCSLIKT